MRFNTPYDRTTDGPKVFIGPSETEPDMHMPVSEIYSRFARGLPLTHNPNAQFTMGEYTPDIQRMDLAEVEALFKKTKGDVEHYQRELDKIRQRMNDSEKQPPKKASKKEADDQDNDDTDA